jgi:diguanylate cyclase (GGDEF)-like protein
MSAVGSFDPPQAGGSTAPAASARCPRWRRARHLLPGFAVAGIGLALSTAAWLAVSRWEDRLASLSFDTTAQNYAMVLQNGLNEYLGKLAALRALFESSPQTTRGEFAVFARRLLQTESAIQNLSWVPRVRRDERAAYERAAARDGLAGFHITSDGEDGRLVSSPERDEYYPIFYATVPSTSRIYGLDLRTEPLTLERLERARDGDQLAVSTREALYSAEGSQHGFIFSLPVYAQGLPHDTVEDRRRNLVGFVHGAFLTGKMIESILAATTTPQAVDLYLFDPHDATGPPMYVHASPLRAAPFAPQPRSALAAGPHWSGDLRAGESVWARLVAAPIPGGPLTARHDRAWIVLGAGLILTAVGAAYVCASSRHARRLLSANRKVSELAQVDPLTGLANRRAFLERLAAAFAASKRGAGPFAVLYFDLDCFKDVNDTLGHAAGDALLRQVAQRAGAAMRQTDILGRLGGDEFAVLQADDADPAAAGVLSARICAALAAPYAINGNAVHVTASIGISAYSADVAGPEAMLMQADLALYHAKQDGRNCYRFHSADLDREVHERVVMADELHVALDRQQFELYYQPQVELASGRIVGLEALLRWNHPARGTIPPAVFIPIAERTGCIVQLGEWAFDAACRQLKLWQDQAIAPPLLAVNFSALQFKGSIDLDRRIAASLAHWSIAPGNIEIELTESVLMEVSKQHADALERLRHLGVRIAIDDFGTGYSSLNYLTAYPVNRLKIAQELVFGVDADSRHATVVRAALRLARELNIEAIAEGVETKEQATFLAAAGCKHAQGYHFSRPVDAERATELLRHGHIVPRRKLLRVIETTAA